MSEKGLFRYPEVGHSDYVAHTHPFNGLFSGTTRVSRYQKGKNNLDFTEARDSEWQWHQLGDMQVCISLHPKKHASTPPLKFFTGRMPFLPPSQQRQSTYRYIPANMQTSFSLDAPIVFFYRATLC